MYPIDTYFSVKVKHLFDHAQRVFHLVAFQDWPVCSSVLISYRMKLIPYCMFFGRLVTILLAALESVHNRDNAFNSLDHMSCVDGSFQTYAFDNRLMVRHHWVYDISLGFSLLHTLSLYT